MNKIKKIIIFACSSIPLIFIDQITKYLAKLNLQNKSEITIIKDVLYFIYHENEGAAFGILQKKQAFFYIITLLFVILMFMYIYKFNLCKKNMLQFISLILIFSGAIGNFIDRFINKYVIDFIYFSLIDFPVFNIADCFITIGAIIFILTSIFTE